MKRAVVEDGWSFKKCKINEEKSIEERLLKKHSADKLTEEKLATQLNFKIKGSKDATHCQQGIDSLKASKKSGPLKNDLPSDKHQLTVKPENNVKSLKMKLKPKTSLQKVMMNDIKVLVKRIEHVENHNEQLQTLITEFEQQNVNDKSESEIDQKLIKELQSLKEANKILLKENELKSRMLQVKEIQVEKEISQNKKILKELHKFKNQHCSSSLNVNDQIKKLKKDLHFYVKAKAKLIEKTKTQKEMLEQKAFHLEEMEKEKDSLMQQKMELQDKVANLTLEILTLKDSQLEWEKERKALHLETEELRKVNVLKVAEIEALNEKMEQTSDEQLNNEKLKDKSNELKKTIGDLEAENCLLKTQLEKESTKVSQLQNHIDKNKKTNEIIKAKVNELKIKSQKEKKDNQTQREELESKVRELQNEKEELKKTHEMLVKQLECQEAKLQNQLEEGNKAHEIIIEELKSKMNDVQNQCEEEKKAHETLIQQLESKDKEILKLKVNLDALIDRVGSDKLKMDEEKEKIAAERLSLQRLSKALDFKMNLMKPKNNISKNNIFDNNSKVSNSEGKLNNQLKEVPIKNVLASTTHPSLNENSQNNVEIKNELTETASKSPTTEKIDNLCSENKINKEDASTLSKVKKNLIRQKHHSDLRRKCSACKTVSIYRAKCRRLQRDNERLTKESEDRFKLLRKLQNKCRELRDSCRKAQEFQKNVTTLKEDLGKLKSKYRKLLEEHTDLKLQFARENKEKEKLLKDNNEIRELSKEYNSILEYLQLCYDGYIQGDLTFQVKAFNAIQNKCKELEKECERLKNRNIELDKGYCRFQSEIELLRHECEKVKENEVSSSNLPSHI